MVEVSMTKVNFSKVEKSFDIALQKLFIDNLSELASLASVIQDPQKSIDNKTIEEIIGRFQKELKKIKKQDPLLYEKLNLTQETEERFDRPPNEYRQEDWLQLKTLKLHIDELKREFSGKEKIEAEHETAINKERKRHINKRFNIRDGWLPLH